MNIKYFAPRSTTELAVKQERAVYQVNRPSVGPLPPPFDIDALEQRMVTRLQTEMRLLLREHNPLLATPLLSTMQAEDEAQIQAGLSTEMAARDWQNQQNIALRNQFLAQCGGLLNAREVADLLASRAKNRAASANQLKDQGKALCVRLHGRDGFPLFQFDPTGQRCYPEMAQVIAALAPAYQPGWQLALWFIAANAWLDDATPLERWATDRTAVVRAAQAEQAMFNE
jgi:hypothetical protein